MKTGIKIISSGSFIEVFEFERPCFYNFTGRGGRKKRDEAKSVKSNEYRQQTIRKNRINIKKLCLSNFFENVKFITLTFNDEVNIDLTDTDAANREFKKFIQRLRRRLGGFKYVATVQFQSKRNAVHYHIMAELSSIPQKDLCELWRNGHVWINQIRISDIEKVANYMSREMNSPRLNGKKAYFTSKNLDKPVTLRGEEANRVIEHYELNSKKEVAANTYKSDYNGIIQYRKYDLLRD
jgi:hypothetical protein